MTYIDTNATLANNMPASEIQKLDRQAAYEYFIQEVNQNTVFFHTLEEKIDHLVKNNLWDKAVLTKYTPEEVKKLFQQAYAFKFRFENFIGAYKFYTTYALRTPDGSRIYERFEDRVVLNALAFSTTFHEAVDVVDAIMSGCFQPATPTFVNAGRAKGGEPVSCFLLDADDNMESIANVIKDSLQLSRRGGGVAINLTDLREEGAPIKGFHGAARGVIPVMKILEDSFSYADQLGQRQGAGAAYLHVMHPDILNFLDTKRENADEKVRIKTLSLGVIIPDLFMEKAKSNENIALFSVYDLEQRGYGRLSGIQWTSDLYDAIVTDEEVKKTFVNPRKILTRIAQIQLESGYPYIIYQDSMNRGNPVPTLGPIRFSNLCTEIAQSSKPGGFTHSGHVDKSAARGYATSCNLGSFNIHRMLCLLESGNEKDFTRHAQTAVKFLTHVSEFANLQCSELVQSGNYVKAAIGVGHMNLHGALLHRGLSYDSEEARELFRRYLANITLWMVSESVSLAAKPWAQKRAEERMGDIGLWSNIIQNQTHWFKTLRPHLEPYVDNIVLNKVESRLREKGMWNMYLQAIPPTGSISYINNSTPSILPVADPVEVRKEAKIGRVYSPADGLVDWVGKTDNAPVETAYSLGYKPIVDMYAAALPYIDQSSSLTLFFKEGVTTRDLNKAQIYAWKKGIKSLYYIRVRQEELTKRIAEVSTDECVACAL